MNYDIDSEIILQKKVNPLIYIYVLVITIIVLSLILISVTFTYQTYYQVVGTVVNEDNHYFIVVYLPKENVKSITGGNILYIDKEKYNYDIVILDSNYLTDNINTYQMVKLDVNIPNKYQINNLNLNLKFLKENKKIINYILNN